MLRFTRKVFIIEKKILLKMYDIECYWLHKKNYPKNLVLFGTKSQPKNLDPLKHASFGVQYHHEIGKIWPCPFSTVFVITFLNFFSFVSALMSAMMRGTWEGGAEATCKTGVHFALRLQETGRASAFFLPSFLTRLLFFFTPALPLHLRTGNVSALSPLPTEHFLI